MYNLFKLNSTILKIKSNKKTQLNLKQNKMQQKFYFIVFNWKQFICICTTQIMFVQFIGTTT